ncbi:MAG: TolC family protein [Planctomycetota bacterium]
MSEKGFRFCRPQLVGLPRRGLCAAIVLALLLVLPACQTPSQHRLTADKVATDIIHEKQYEALGHVEKFSIERPSDILRRRLLIEQDLPYSSEASLGTDKLKTIEHWPEEDYPSAVKSPELPLPVEPNKPPQLSLIEALQIGARNSFEYQTLKEEIFRFALDLDLERNEFRNIFAAQVESLASTDTTGDRTVSGTEISGAAGLNRKLESGAELSTALAIDLANLLTMGGASSLGIAGDATVAIPLLRGSGKHIAREPLTQAERNVVYAINKFERFKRTFAVEIASEYLAALEQLDSVRNAEGNYRSLVEIQVDQAVQNELVSRNRWIVARESYQRSLDSFKSLLGLPPDAEVELERSELDRLAEQASEIIAEIARQEQTEADQEPLPADAPIELVAPSREGAGPLEMDKSSAIQLALENRLDLRVSQGEVYDAQRAVVVAADALRAELTLFGAAELGERRSIDSATDDDAQLRFDEGVFSALLTLDLPLERTPERNAYRNSLISLERAVRNVQILEDEIKLSVRNKLRDLLQSRESFKIQAQSVLVAEKRVKSTTLFLEAGKEKTQIRDLLEAQDDLLAAQNRLTSAAVNYRVAELELQRDLGLLKIDEQGLWQEYLPERADNAEQ